MAQKFDRDNLVRLRQIIEDCTLCPRHCHVDRTAGETGACGIGENAVVASTDPHFGEEPVLVGSGGSGTIFMSGCNLACVFCQNCDISQQAGGQEVTASQLAELMLESKSRGCVNCNFVSPTHVAHAIAEAITIARDDGLTVPIVYNTGGYDAVDTLKLLEGLIDIYMPDFKWASSSASIKYSQALNYPSIAAEALTEMYRQVGPLQTDSSGVATCGVLVRHLVMPHDLARSRDCIAIIASCAPGCAINIMGQYHPAFRAGEYPELLDSVEPGRVERLRLYAEQKGMVRVDH